MVCCYSVPDNVWDMRCCDNDGDYSWEECGLLIYADKYTQNKQEWQREVMAYEMTKQCLD